MPEKSDLLWRFLASITYHATKAIKNASERYPELDIGMGVRTLYLVEISLESFPLFSRARKCGLSAYPLEFEYYGFLTIGAGREGDT